MELKQLKIFATLAREMNFTRVAEKLGYTQSNITLQIKSMEGELGTKLFNRMGRQLSLTEEGERLLPVAMEMLELEHAVFNVTHHSVEEGSIRIGVCDSLCISRLPRIIGAYKKRYPKVKINLSILKCSEFYPLLQKNQIDMAFTIGYLQKEEEICYIGEMPEPIWVLSGTSHPLCGKKHLTAEDFSGVPLILTEAAAYYRQNFVQELIRANITPQIMVETESIQAIKKLAEQGLGICILPETAVLEEIKEKRLVPLDYTCDYGIYSHIIWHKKKQLSPCQKEFLSYSSDIIREDVWEV